MDYTKPTIISSGPSERGQARNSSEWMPKFQTPETSAAADSTISDLPPWEAKDYRSTIDGSGSEKLAESGVAPLVAAARGYTRIKDTNLSAELETMGVRAGTSQRRRWSQTLSKPGYDAMQMPWFSPASVQNARRRNETPTPVTYQVRFESPSVNEFGIPMEYDFVNGTATPLDLHPATPVSWIDSAPVVMIVEGMLSGDAALSAYLHSKGASWDELRSEDVADPRTSLRALMERIPEEDRVLIVSIDRVYDAGHSIDWREIALRDRIAWLALTSNVTPNHNVAKAISKLYRQLDEKSGMSQIFFLNPECNSGRDGEISRVAVDEYVAKVGTWNELTAQLSLTMPEPPPSRVDEKPGKWRVSQNGLFVEKCVVSKDGRRGYAGEHEWLKQVDLGGRVLAVESVRQPTDQELRTGLLDPSVKPYNGVETRVEVEVCWAGPGGNGQTAIVTGPINILGSRPEDWHAEGAIIPFALLRHPAWPPRRYTGDMWLAAVKDHRADEIDQTVRWMHMGWVPTDDGRPVYLVGDQVIGDAHPNETVRSGVDGRFVPGAEYYGVGDLADGNFDDEGYRKVVLQDFQMVLEAYIHSGAWTEPSTAAIVLAAALRPTVPIRPRTSIYLWGPKGMGKSWTAHSMLYFWARTTSAWQSELPGQAKDTASAIENALAYTPIWVIDDLAPSSMKHQAAHEDAKIADIIRAVFNNGAKARMRPDMTPMRTNKPRAQLIVTAENEMTIPSVKERLIPVYLGPGKLSPTTVKTRRIKDLARTQGLQARFTSHVLRYIRHAADRTPGGWAAYVAELEGQRYEVQEVAMHQMERLSGKSSSVERSTSLAADLLLTFKVLAAMAEELDMDADVVRMLGVHGLGLEIIKLVNDAHGDNQQAAPGTSLVRALSSLLASGAAHVVSGDDSSRPPFEPNENGGTLANHGLGWIGGSGDGSPVPGGLTIGTVVTVNDSEGNPRKVILFEIQTAFNKAQATYPALIPYGQRAGSAWASVWDEDLTPSYMPRTKNSAGGDMLTVRRSVGRHRISGVPIEVDLILGGVAS